MVDGYVLQTSNMCFAQHVPIYQYDVRSVFTNKAHWAHFSFASSSAWNDFWIGLLLLLLVGAGVMPSLQPSKRTAVPIAQQLRSEPG